MNSTFWNTDSSSMDHYMVSQLLSRPPLKMDHRSDRSLAYRSITGGYLDCEQIPVAYLLHPAVAGICGHHDNNEGCRPKNLLVLTER